MNCKKIFHLSMPRSACVDQTEVRNIFFDGITECLVKAEQTRCRVIAFPMSPLQAVTQVEDSIQLIHAAFKNYGKPVRCLDIHLVDNDLQVVKAIQDAMEEYCRWDPVQMTRGPSHDASGLGQLRGRVTGSASYLAESAGKLFIETFPWENLSLTLSSLLSSNTGHNLALRPGALREVYK